MPKPTSRNTPSTNTNMISLTLPPEDRRAVLRSFWIVISLILGTGLWLVGWWFQAPFPLTIGLIAGTVCALLVFVNQEFVRRLYHAWNRRIVRPYANLASRAVMRICFFIILLATGKTGSRFGLGRHAVTSWERRSSLPAEAYGLPYAAQGEASAGTGWIRGYLSWAIRSGNGWSISLLPFLWFLRLLSYEEKKPFAANIYTLF
jgi:hypothetical protein